MNRPSRRLLIRQAVGLVAAGLLPVDAVRAEAEPSDLETAILDCLTDRDGAAMLGARYLGGLGDPARRDAYAMEIPRLCRAILGMGESADRRLHYVSAAREARTSAIRKCVNDDFSSGRTVELDGWVVSRTELLLCLLAARVCGRDRALPADHDV